MRKDLEYIDNRSLVLDWKILRLTIPGSVGACKPIVSLRPIYAT